MPEPGTLALLGMGAMAGLASSKAPEQQTAEVRLKEHVAMAFGTPVVAYHWPDSEGLNKELRELILTAETQTAGRVRSNVKGWHSETDFFKWDAGARAR